jgi:hypothetical protein
MKLAKNTMRREFLAINLACSVPRRLLRALAGVPCVLSFPQAIQSGRLGNEDSSDLFRRLNVEEPSDLSAEVGDET